LLAYTVKCQIMILSTSVSRMNNLSIPSNPHNSNWQALGECKLSLNASMDARIQAWLKENLSSLSLNTDFLDRILRSAQDSATRAFQAGVETKFEHIHLRVFTPESSISNKKTWGFFLIEKVGTPVANTNRVDHSIEFYLYREG
jgi:hypothetical protein